MSASKLILGVPVTRDEIIGKVQEANFRRLFAVRVMITIFSVFVLLGLGLVLVRFSPSENPFYPRCLSYTLTGLHCPGCGTTRSLHAALNGHFRQALAYNLLMPIIVPLFAYSFLLTLYRQIWGIRTRASRYRKTTNALLWLLMGVMILYGIARNIPTEPFSSLAPRTLTP
jgi:hypothetical protein